MRRRLHGDAFIAHPQAALEGTMSLEGLLRSAFPLDWRKQREMIAGLG